MKLNNGYYAPLWMLLIPEDYSNNAYFQSMFVILFWYIKHLKTNRACGFRKGQKGDVYGDRIVMLQL